MERLLVLRLECIGVTAEAVLNGIPVARIKASPEAASVITVPIHEYTVAGGNEIELVIEPPPPGRTAAPKPLLSNGRRGASLRLLHEIGRRGLIKPQHDHTGFDLGALAAGGFDLQARACIGQHSAGLEYAVFLEQDVSAGHQAKPVTRPAPPSPRL
jgi:hypothetical protein